MATVLKITPIREVEVMPKEDYEAPELKIAVSDDRHKFCAHEHIKLYEHHRLVQCSDCGATLDPFEHLLTVGKKESGQLSHLTWLRYHVKHLEQDAETLKREISKLKSQKKKLA
jgi:hypothetical protein